ncbi:MAG: carboxypeptidase-like regulatory domain-containing protein [Patescibacteria group bacterium]
MLKFFNSKFNKNNNYHKGITLIEVVIGLGLMAILIQAVYFGFSNVLEATGKDKSRFDGIAILEKEIEIIRNMPFSDVGISGGYPSGKLLAEKNIQLGQQTFIIKTTVRNIDDSFDGTIGGNPNDTAPADYKLIELEVSCNNCYYFKPIHMNTTVAPQGLESDSNNGSLFINVFDANGQPVSSVDVEVVNNALNPIITINDNTNINGILQLVDIPTSTSAYEITVSKSGYSSDKTYPIGGAGNPNPNKPHATIGQQQITQISFSIDKVSSLNIASIDKMCQAVPNVDFLQEGIKTIGAPDVLKYSVSSATNSNGLKTISGLEWDSYNFLNQDDVYDFSGTMPFLPIAVNPDTASDLKLIMEQKNPLAFLVSVSDENGLPIKGASVELSKIGFNQTVLTGKKNIIKTDWSGGNYFEQSGGVEVDNPAGEMKLKIIDGKYSTSSAEWLISNTIDFGTSTTEFFELSWNPESQPPQAGNDSLKFQIAANNDNATWNFIGPDGSAGSFYTASGGQISASQNGNRYLKIRAYLQTADENYTPILEDFTISFYSGCVPAGQALFGGLNSDTYSLTVQKTGYASSTEPGLSIFNSWQEYKATLNSN